LLFLVYFGALEIWSRVFVCDFYLLTHGTTSTQAKIQAITSKLHHMRREKFESQVRTRTVEQGLLFHEREPGGEATDASSKMGGLEKKKLKVSHLTTIEQPPKVCNSSQEDDELGSVRDNNTREESAMGGGGAVELEVKPCQMESQEVRLEVRKIARQKAKNHLFHPYDKKKDKPRI